MLTLNDLKIETSPLKKSPTNDDKIAAIYVSVHLWAYNGKETLRHAAFEQKV